MGLDLSYLKRDRIESPVNTLVTLRGRFAAPFASESEKALRRGALELPRGGQALNQEIFCDSANSSTSVRGFSHFLIVFLSARVS